MLRDGYFMFFAIIIAVNLLFFLICYAGTGNDEKNIKSYSSYPDEIQKIIKSNTRLYEKTKITSPIATFMANIIMFGVILLIFGFLIKQDSFEKNFINIFILGQCLNAFDFL